MNRLYWWIIDAIECQDIQLTPIMEQEIGQLKLVNRIILILEFNLKREIFCFRVE